MSAMHVAVAGVAEENHARAEAALTRGAERLLALQNDDGSWGKPPMIGITALCVIALHDAPGIDVGKRDAAIDAGIESLLDDLDEDGTTETLFGLRSQPAFWKKTPRYATYSIAVTLLAMATVDKPEHIPLIKRGRAYLRTLQRVNPNSKHHGGFGYGGGGRSANLSITAWSAEAMYHTAYVEGDVQGADPTVTAQNEAMWASIEAFLEATQKNPGADQDAAADSDADTILGLESGANDYVAKPFKFAVLLARIRSHLRQHEQSEDAVFSIGPYTFRPSAKLLLEDESNQKARLTQKETSILKYLFRAGDKAVSRDVLLNEVWGYNAGVATHTLETHIYRLRQKIETDPSSAEILVTEPGGYRLVP